MTCLRALLLGCILLSGNLTAVATPVRIVKVLPHFLDLQGRHSVSPSLFDRDAYQAYLRKNPQLCSGIRFDVQWKIKSAITTPIKLRVEIRSSKGYNLKPYVIEQSVIPPRWFSRWSGLAIKDEDFQKLGKIIAWRVTLWEGDNCLAEQKSFLW